MPNGARHGRPQSPAEFDRIVGKPLAVAKLAAIWRTLPEQDRLGFILELDEEIADKLIVMVYEEAK